MEGTEPIRFLVILAVDDGIEENDQLITLNHFAPAYYLFRDQGAEVVLATLAGDYPPLPAIGPTRPGNGDVRRLLDDRLAREELADTLAFDQIATEDFDAAFCLGLCGNLWKDGDRGPAALITSLLEDGKPVAIIPGHSLDLSPKGARKGLIIVGDAQDAPLMAAHALLKIVGERRAVQAKN